MDKSKGTKLSMQLPINTAKGEGDDRKKPLPKEAPVKKVVKIRQGIADYQDDKEAEDDSADASSEKPVIICRIKTKKAIQKMDDEGKKNI